VVGIGPVLALVISLEIGDIGRFPSAGDFVSYCRLVDSKKTSNDKKKGEGSMSSARRRLLAPSSPS
jgi:transposase